MWEWSEEKVPGDPSASLSNGKVDYIPAMVSVLRAFLSGPSRRTCAHAIIARLSVRAFEHPYENSESARARQL